MPRATIPPLLGRFPIVDPKTGTPSLQFQRLWQDLFGNEAGTYQDAANANATADAAVPQSRLINTVTPIQGGGPLSDDLTLSHNTSGVTAGSYTSANITVDADGHVTAAANGSGGGGNPWWWSPPNAVAFSLISGDATSPVVTDDTDIGMVLTFGSVAVTGEIVRAAVETITSPSAAWTYQARMAGTVYSANFCSLGLMVRNVANNKNLFLGLGQDGSVKLQYRTMTSFSSTASSGFAGTIQDFADTFFKVAYDGSANIKFYMSAEGKHWRLVWTEPVSNFLGAVPDRIGFAITTNNGGASDDLALAVQRRVKSW